MPPEALQKLRREAEAAYAAASSRKQAGAKLAAMALAPADGAMPEAVAAQLRALGSRAATEGGDSDARSVLPPPPSVTSEGDQLLRPWQPAPGDESGANPALPAPDVDPAEAVAAFFAYWFGEVGGADLVCCALPRVPSLLAAEQDPE